MLALELIFWDRKSVPAELGRASLRPSKVNGGRRHRRWSKSEPPAPIWWPNLAGGLSILARWAGNGRPPCSTPKTLGRAVGRLDDMLAYLCPQTCTHSLRNYFPQLMPALDWAVEQTPQENYRPASHRGHTRPESGPHRQMPGECWPLPGASGPCLAESGQLRTNVHRTLAKYGRIRAKVGQSQANLSRFPADPKPDLVEFGRTQRNIIRNPAEHGRIWAK